MTPQTPLVTVIIPVYNEEEHLEECLRSLQGQTYRPVEIIVVDDGSRDTTVTIALRCGVQVLQQSHWGKARALARGAAAAQGEIFVFLDGDLHFASDFVERLVTPIVEGQCVGTSHDHELVANPQNVWSRCFQKASGLPLEKRIDLSPSERARGTVVYRAVRAEAFRKVGGFDDVGYTDDQTLATKLGGQARFANGAVCYHYNPASLSEVFGTGAWGGKSIWHRRRWRGLLDYFPPRGVVRGLGAAVRHRFLPLALYVWVMEAGIFWGVAKRVIGLDRTYGA
ncbi:MAG TPA: glycosyltransferase family 2 protein [Gemmatimonadaceae bacterium]